ncbi:MAG: AMP-binding protein [Pseudobacteriovorax sp.]|nr:AMP-binding protein [Pseudobacteriovorax sp.]
MWSDLPTQSDLPAVTFGELSFTFSELFALVSHNADIITRMDATYIVTDSSNPLTCWIIALATLFTGKRLAILNPKIDNNQRSSMLDNLDETFAYYEAEIPRNIPSIRKLPSLKRSLEDPWVVLFTSGSSGNPKGVVHSFGSLQEAAKFSNRHLQANRSMKWLQSIALHHIGGFMILMRSLVGRQSVVLCQDYKRLAETIIVTKPDFLSLVPTQLIDLLRVRDCCEVLSQSQGVLVGGASLSSTLITAIRQYNLPIIVSYGSTESGAMLLGSKLGDVLYPKFCGRPLMGRNVRLNKQDKLEFSDEGSFLGYLSHGVFNPRPQWFLTSDRFAINVQGDFEFLGRDDRIFQRGGENISPDEIISRLESEEVGLNYDMLGWPDERLGHVPYLIVMGSQPHISQLLSHIRDRLAVFQRPVKIFWQSTLGSSDKWSRQRFEQALASGELVEIWNQEG